MPVHKNGAQRASLQRSLRVAAITLMAALAAIWCAPRVSEAVADTATETSNAARRVARKARTTTKRVGSAVADTATDASNAARTVARKAKATAEAA